VCENEIGFDKEKQGEMGKDEEKSRSLYSTLTHLPCISYQASFSCISTHRLYNISVMMDKERPRTRGRNITSLCIFST